MAETRVRRWIEKLRQRYQPEEGGGAALVVRACPRRRFRAEPGDAFNDPLPKAITPRQFKSLGEMRPTIQSRGRQLVVRTEKGQYCVGDEVAITDAFYRDTYKDAALSLANMSKLVTPRDPLAIPTDPMDMNTSTDRAAKLFEPLAGGLQCDPDGSVPTRWVDKTDGPPTKESVLASKREIRSGEWHRPFWIPESNTCADATPETSALLETRDPSWFHHLGALASLKEESKPTNVEGDTVADADLYMDASLCAQQLTEEMCADSDTSHAPFGRKISPAQRCVWKKGIKEDRCQPMYLDRMTDAQLDKWFARFQSVEQELMRRQKEPFDLKPEERKRRLYRFPIHK